VATVWFDGIDALNTLAQDLGDSGAKAARAGWQVLRRTALAVEGTAKQFAPVDTGALRNSIDTEMVGGPWSAQAEAIVGSTLTYAGFVEYGTARMAPRAYLGPALDRHAPDYVAGLAAIANPLD